MKHTNIYAFNLIVALTLAYTSSSASANYIYSNGISATNIATFQHNIATSLLANRPNMRPALKPEINSVDLYGHPSLYGEYKEYEFMYGHSGGETGTHNGARLTMNTFNENLTLNTTHRLANKTNMATIDFAFTNNSTQKIGAYTGFIDNEASNNDLKLKTSGGYVGLYGSQSINKIQISGIIDGGAVSNSATSTFGTDEFTNLWLGAGINTTYDIMLGDTFDLQPGIYIGYTWADGANYISASAEQISAQNFNMFEVSPTLRAIKYIAADWYGTMHVRYVMIETHGGDTFVNGTKLTALESDNFVEYGLSLEKNIENFQFSASIIRRDGWHDGFGGNLGIKYIF